MTGAYGEDVVFLLWIYNLGEVQVCRQNTTSRSTVGREAVTLLMLMVEKRKLPFNEHADEILLDLVGMSEGEVGRFIDGLPAPSYFRCPASRLDSPYAKSSTTRRDAEGTSFLHTEE